MSQASRADTEALPWWKTSVFCPVYPRSFLATEGNGVGDLQGIRRRQGRLAWLGVDPLFGSLDDFDRLRADAHRLGLRVTITWVPNYTSPASVVRRIAQRPPGGRRCSVDTAIGALNPETPS